MLKPLTTFEHTRLCVVSLLFAGLLATFGYANETGDEARHYLANVKPIFQQRCYPCHGASKQESGLRLDTAAAMYRGGSSGPIVDTSKVHESALLSRVSSPDSSLRMPPDGKPLTSEEIRAIELWIADGAKAPPNEAPQQDPRQHWAFQSPNKPALPQNEIADRFAHPVDKLLSIQQIRESTTPQPEADRATLARRLYLDLLGIPPTPDEMNDFLGDGDPMAYENLVNRLLDRHEFGQRWGRHWMDVWRYSDWYGRRSVPDVMNSYPQIWRWRDWIIESLNDDKGYDQMLQEMLAADELCPTEDRNVVATGFLVRNWYKWNYETWMKDNVEHTGKAFLGLTLNCAHCHDHKYDPITHEDYFRFRAFFEPLELRHDRVAGLADPGPFKKYVYAESYGPIKTGAIRVFDEKLDAKTYMYSGGDARNRIEGKSHLDPSPPVALLQEQFEVSPINLPAQAAYPGLKEFVKQDEYKRLTDAIDKSESLLATAAMKLSQSELQLDTLRGQAAANQPSLPEAAKENVQFESQFSDALRELALAKAEHRVAIATKSSWQAKLEALRCRIAADDAKYASQGNPALLATLASQSEKQANLEEAQASIAMNEKNLLIALHQLSKASTEQTDKAQKEKQTAENAVSDSRKKLDAAIAELATPSTSYTPLSPAYPNTSTGRRLALARWITNKDNPLTARVAVNHIWLRHFGRAIVETTDNFGVQGKQPEQPELLDWLAVEFMENSWSMKHIHRVILTSAAYRRSSRTPSNNSSANIDPLNKTYWRTNLRRMEAEVVRDSVLHCSKSLDLSLNGPEIDPATWFTSNRRSLYFTIHGEAKMQFLDSFDGPNVCECYQRTSSILPQQALAMTNSELLVNQGRILAGKIREQLGIPLGSYVDSASNSESKLPQSPNCDEPFVKATFESVLNRQPDLRELALSIEFLEQQRQLLAQANSAELSTKPVAGVIAASADIAQRARENLATSLFSHNDFVTIR